MIRVLHVVGVMNHGGAEKRLLELARYVDKSQIHFDFCVFKNEPGAYADEILKLGFGIVKCRLSKNVFGFINRFNAILRRGKYDAVHCHIYNFAGLPLLLAAKQGVPTRIMHIRTMGNDTASSLLKALWWKLMGKWARQYATKIVANSQCGMIAYMGPQWQSDTRTEIIYGGIDLKPFQIDFDRENVLAEFGISAFSPVIIHVGNFGPAKNHEGLVSIAKIVIAKRNDVHFILIGDGPLRPYINELVIKNNLKNNIHFAGQRNDVPKLLMSSDCFLFPSKWEGLPGALVEALVAGLPVVASDIKPNCEVAKFSDNIKLVPLTDEEGFANEVNNILCDLESYKRHAGQIPQPFQLNMCLQKTLALYKK